MDLITAPLYLLLTVYQFALIIRIIFNITESYARLWRPQGLVLMLAVGVYAVTDPPLRWLNRKIPPLNLGGVSLDMAFIVVFLAVVIAKSLIAGSA
ncbi:YggT family protein [Nesterenkonia sphaerica]|uniref:YggT family protein n=1 Tax=Nesterenkonia sphaerica TaxID=1804988 RepID=A0A5R9AGX7_9MICC|nr:YggT family protein [Nesterenkonia sphaerica]TLP77414.1 YggT family protein [Nesterenkonia sphaerica]